jgi:hypothetical protein
MEVHICTFCKNTFKTKYSLKIHENTSKKCIKQRCNNNNMLLEHICNYCSKIFTTKQNLESHLVICKRKAEDEKTEQTELINKLTKENEGLKQTKKFLKNEIENKNKLYNELKLNYDNLLNKLERIEEKYLDFASKSKVINTTTTNNYTTQNSTNNLTVKQYVSQLQPITAIDFQNTLQHYTDKYIDEGAIGYAKFLLDHPCNNKIVTTDLSRKIVAYRTDKNEFIKDPKCRELIKMAIVDHKNDILSICTKRRKTLGDMKTLDDDSYMNDVYTKKINDITEFIIFLKNDLEDYVETNVPNKISSEITNRSQQYTNVKTNVMELE